MVDSTTDTMAGAPLVEVLDIAASLFSGPLTVNVLNLAGLTQTSPSSTYI